VIVAGRAGSDESSGALSIINVFNAGGNAGRLVMVPPAHRRKVRLEGNVGISESSLLQSSVSSNGGSAGRFVMKVLVE
jgi:hypothetical protein